MSSVSSPPPTPSTASLPGTRLKVGGAPLSALATARNIDDIGAVQYPEGVMSPKPELNANVKDGRFRYDRGFLLQFMGVCTQKPDMLPPLEAIGLMPLDQASLGTRGGSGRHRKGLGAAAPQRQASVGLGFGPSSSLANSSSRSASVNVATGLPFNRPVSMQRPASQGGASGALLRHRTRSERRRDRNEMKKVQQGDGSDLNNFQANTQNVKLDSVAPDPVAPLQVSAYRWDRKAMQIDPDSPELVDRKVKALLNKLTMKNFDSISDQVIAWANKSEKEKDERTLNQVIRLVVERAVDEALWSEMYARLCMKMMEQISSKVQDDGIKNAEGKPIAGGQLFRKILLKRCEEDFERGLGAKDATTAAASVKASEDEAAKAANQQSREGGTEEVALYSDEYYAAQKVKRQGLGLIKFIGELFKLQILTQRIMHEYVKLLLGNVESLEEVEIESLCKLLTTVGASLDTQKARADMDVYFSRMKELTKSQNVSSRMQFMLQDIIELRERKWIPCNAVAAPEPDGCVVAGSGSGAPPSPPKVGDLSNFGKAR